MKALIFLTCLIIALATHAATPSFQSFNQGVFNTNGNQITLDVAVSNYVNVTATNAATQILGNTPDITMSYTGEGLQLNDGTNHVVIPNGLVADRLGGRTNTVPFVANVFAGLGSGGTSRVITNSSASSVSFTVELVAGAITLFTDTNLCRLDFNQIFTNPPLVFVSVANPIGWTTRSSANMLHVPHTTTTVSNCLIMSGSTALLTTETNFLNVLIIGK